jgi:hypothetical protein
VSAPLKILFIARHYSYLRLFESAVIELAGRGHTITLAADRDEQLGGRQMVERIAARFRNVTLADAPGRTGAWAEVARRVRLALDYLRFLDPLYESTPHLRRRVRERGSTLIRWMIEARAWQMVGGLSIMRTLLRALERGLPGVPAIESFLRRQAPDVLLVTPMIDIGSPQLDHLASAQRLGIRTVLPVGSWDHLSSKALLRAWPDRLIVWNDIQRREAIEMHGVPAERIVVTGAQCYDQWFDRKPARGREAFCARVGLPADRPFVLYICSSLFRETVLEPAFVERWIRAVRGSDDPRLKDIGILVRPHPARLDEWTGVDLSGYRDVSFWGAHPVDADAKADYFDSMYYSAAVVGLNTSAMLEAGIVGKPVHTVLLPEISADNQEGTLHFRYLTTVNGGLLWTSRSLDEHLTLLAGSLAGEGGGDERARQFVEGFIRPFGRSEAATPRFVAAIEDVAAQPAPAPTHLSLAGMAARAALSIPATVFGIRAASHVWRTRTWHRLRKDIARRRARFMKPLRRLVDDVFQMRRATPAAGTSQLAPKAGRQRDPAKQLAGTELPEARETRGLVRALARGDRPIILGPWTSETGFELLYWIPFLAWAKQSGGFDSRRLIAVSRGGAAAWYSGITSQYQDIFSFCTPDELRAANQRRIDEQGGRLKHVAVSDFDRDIVERVQQRLGLSGTELLHPSLMYALFDQFWLQRAPLTLVEAFTRFAPLAPAPPSGIRSSLPARYVAARFYGNSALPADADARAFASNYLSDLVQHTDVVLLNTAHQFDDHADFPPAVHPRLHRIDHLMSAEHNLAVQTEVIQHASGFVGTYGGFSYLAPLCGVNTLAFYSRAGGFRFDHLDVAKRAFASLRCGTFTEIDIRAIDVLRLGFGGPAPVGADAIR